MTTTAFDDQFTPSTQTIKIVHAPYEPVAILKRNVAELELALKRQTERAEKAEVELARLPEQKPVAWCDPVEFKDDPWSFQGFRCRTSNYPTMPLYAAPVPAPHKGATHCDDCGLTWLDDGLNPLGCPYCKAAAPAPAPAPAPAVPAEWREVMTELAADVQAACDAEHPHRDQYPSVMRKYNNDMGIVEKARALLQSAEVQAGDKWNLTPAPTHPVDRNAGEVRHD